MGQSVTHLSIWIWIAPRSLQTPKISGANFWGLPYKFSIVAICHNVNS